MGAAEERATFATGNTAGTQAGGLCESKSLAIVCVKGFDFEGGAVGLREQSDTAIRHRPVHVHEEQFDLRGALLEGGRDVGNTSQGSLRGEGKREFTLLLAAYNLPDMLHSPLSPEHLREMRDRAREMFDRALLECNIRHAFAQHVQYEDGQLRIGDDSYGAVGRGIVAPYDGRVLISGGASAIAEKPISADISPADVSELMRRWCIREHPSRRSTRSASICWR